MTTDEYKRRLIEYLQGSPSEAALRAVANIVSDWTENATDPSGDKLHVEIYGPPWTCEGCGMLNHLPGECSDCEGEGI